MRNVLITLLSAVFFTFLGGSLLLAAPKLVRTLIGIPDQPVQIEVAPEPLLPEGALIPAE